jgi:tetratricopeptide repeat protein
VSSEPRPSTSEGSESHASVSPVLGTLLRLLAEQWEGTLLAHDARAERIAALCFEPGFVVAARVEHASGGLLLQIAALCERDDLHFTLIDGRDMVGRGPGIARGQVDSTAIAALREQTRSSQSRPRAVSGEVARAAADEPLDAAKHDEDPTVIVALDNAARRLDAPHRAPAADDGEDAVKRLRYADPDRSIGAVTDRYHVQNPEHGTTRSQPPRGVTSAPASLEADFHFRAAEELLARGRARDAVFEAQKAMKLGTPRPEQRALYAWLLYQRGGPSRSVHPRVWSHLKQALESDPACVRALYYKGMLLAASGRRIAAIEHLERACQLDPTDAEAAQALSSLRHG